MLVLVCRIVLFCLYPPQHIDSVSLKLRLRISASLHVYVRAIAFAADTRRVERVTRTMHGSRSNQCQDGTLL